MAVIGAILAIFIVTFELRFVFSYRVEKDVIKILLFQVIPFYKIPIDAIESIHKASWMECGMGGLTLRLGNRVFGHCVLIQKRNGLVRRVVITPGDADGFIGQVQKNKHAQ